jgi:hypothetical protein
VHLPEFALGAGEFGGFSGGLGVRMALRQREIAEDKEQALAESASARASRWGRRGRSADTRSLHTRRA